MQQESDSQATEGKNTLNLQLAFDSFPSRETQNGVRFINFFDLSRPEFSQQREQFMRAVEASKGTARLAVHPYYRQNVTGFEAQERLWQHAQPDRTPIIIFEEAAEAENTCRRIAEQSSEGSVFYVVPTWPDASTPNMVELPQNSGAAREIKNIAWDDLTHRFSELGIKKTIVGGQRLEFKQALLDFDESGVERVYMEDEEERTLIPVNPRDNEAWVQEYRAWEAYCQQKGMRSDRKNILYPTRCEGRTILELLKRGVDVDISAISFPEKGQLQY